MKSGLKPGDVSVVTFVVTRDMFAAFEERTIHEVLSTFHLVYYSEYAARRLVEPYLEEGENAVGAEIRLKHLSPGKLGDEIKVTALLKSVKGRKVLCELKAMHGRRQICSGSQTQILVKEGWGNSK